jgi:RNA polymerase sigma-70 factor (ECF subfamily)
MEMLQNFCGKLANFNKKLSFCRILKKYRKKPVTKCEFLDYKYRMRTDMDTSISQLEVFELITKAQAGDYESMSSLALQVQGKVTSYIYRLTLNQDVAEDLSQETLMHMVKSLKELENPEAFWSWLYRTALGKVQHYFRDRKRRKSVQMSTVDEERLSAIDVEKDQVLGNMEKKELSEAVFKAMGKLKLRYRSVLSLRCYDRMPYSEVATLMDCSELRARVLFYRAKYSLRQHGKGLVLQG